jgi:cytochrome c553
MDGQKTTNPSELEVVMVKTMSVTLISIMWMPALWGYVQSQSRFQSNGEAIYYERTNQDGFMISFDEGPKWLKSRRLGCVACHGPKGKGGYLIWPSLKMAPDIRYDSLVKEAHLHGGKTETHPRYTDELLKRAVTEGINAAGKPLDPVMPRWKLSDRDFVDLLAYLKQLSEGIAPPPEPFPREP